MALNSSNSNAGSNPSGIVDRGLPTPHPQSPNTNEGTKTNNPQPTFNIDDIFNPNISGNLNIDKPNINNSNTTEPNQGSWQAPPDLWKGPTLAKFGEDPHYQYGTEPTMTVDEVYDLDKKNQPVVEKQGDYYASSNEKSNVKSSTFGNQDEISVTPTSVTENKGMIGNGAIQSVEGLNFQQKDKASQEVLDGRKKRDEAEAEDEADQMRNKLKGGIGKAAQQEGGENFKIGTSEAEKAFNKENAKKQAELEQKKKEVAEAEKNYNKSKESSKLIDENLDSLKNQYEIDLRNADQELNILKRMKQQADEMNSKGYLAKKLNERSDAYKTMKQKILEYANEQGLKYVEIESTEDIVKLIDTLNSIATESRDNIVTDYKSNKERMEKQKVKADADSIINKGILDEAVDDYKKAEDKYNAWKKGAEANLKAGTTPEPEPTSEPQPETPSTPEPETPQSNAETSHEDAMNAIKNSENATPEQKAEAEEALANLEESRQKLAEAAALAGSGDPAHLVEYQEALEKYNENLKKAQKIGNRWTQTDFNPEYTRAVAAANDFRVTFADGTEMEYSDFAKGEATKSPQYAKAMYDAKADQFEQQALEDEKNGNKVSAFINRAKAKIERWKSEWSQTWLGSKLTQADDKVRDQFTQMAKTDMRATYAAYNNILNDPNATPEQKAEASTAINQANALMTASAALQATTGFLSSIGDSPSDGTFGTTDPTALEAHQEILNSIDNFIKVTLGLGILPAANEAYQNMYYMNRDKEQDSGLFTTDFDKDGFALCQEYGNSAAAGLITGAGELGVGVAMLFNPATMADGINLIVDAFSTINNGLYGVRNKVEKSQQYTQQVLEYFKEAEDIAESSGNEEAIQEITNAIAQIENFELKSDEVGNLDNWLEGSGSNTTSNEKFNQALNYDEWLKLIEADPTMREFAKTLAEKKKKEENAQKDDADTGVNS